jgi:uncharacterized membrane protein
MTSLAIACILAIVFVVTHVGLAALPVRARLVDALGAAGFRWLFFAVAATSFSALVAFYADHRSAGPPGFALGTSAALRPALMALAVLGVVLMVASFATYGGGPYDVAGGGRSRGPRGLERVTRHPFFVGMALFAGAHALLATRLIGTVLMAALAGLAAGGAVHQDTKLLRLRGDSFAAYLAVTSNAPFVAIVGGRQRLAWDELPWAMLALGAAIAAALRTVHAEIFAHRGAWVVLVAVGGPLALVVPGLVAHRRRVGQRGVGAVSRTGSPG